MTNFRQMSMRFTALVMLMSVMISASAKEVTAEQARSTAAQFAMRTVAQSAGHHVSADPSALTLAYTAHSAQAAQSANYYVFNRPADNGFIIVSGDDRLPAILGYSPEGSFNDADMPPAAKWWMEQYNLEIEAFMASAKDEAAPSSPANDSRKPIEPLLKTMWDQSTPYNDLCPIDNGARSFTGCVATAMAMVLNYHQWPKEPVAKQHTDANNANAYFNYNTTYDWANMLDVYDAESPQAAQDAVAKLMLACGVAMDMQYSSASGGSGAYSSFIPAALRTYFNYDGNVKFEQGSYYTTQQWNDLVYTELADNGPVLFSGLADNGGHQFVADGYATGGYFHINWGWSGAYNGFFLLSALDPAGQGIGGFEGGYNKNQGVVTGVKPASAITGGEELSILSVGGYEYDGLVEWQYDNFTLANGDEDGYFYNQSPEDFNVLFAMRIQKLDSDAAPDYAYDTEVTTLQGMQPNGSVQAYGSMYFDIRSKNLANGTYRLTPVYAIVTDNFSASTARWVDFPITVGQKNIIEMTKSSSGYSFKTYAEYTPEISWTSASWTGVHLNTPEKITINLKNSGTAQWSGTLALHVFERSADSSNINNSIWSQEMDCNLPAGMTTAVEQEFMMTTPWFTTGPYQFALFTEDGQRLGAPLAAFEITDADYPEGVTTPVRVTSLDPLTWYCGQTLNLTAGMVNTTSVTQKNVNVIVDIQPLALDGNYGSPLNVELAFGNFSEKEGGFKSALIGVPDDGTMYAGKYNVTYLQKSTSRPMSAVYEVDVLMPYDGVYYGADDRFVSPEGFVGVQPQFEAPAQVVVRESIASVTTDGKALTTVTSIAANAFADQPFVKKITLSASIKSIGKGAFARTPELTEIVFEGAQPDMEDVESVFADTNPELTVYVKPEYYEQYASVLEGHVGHVYAMIESMSDATVELLVGDDHIVNVKVNDGVGRINPAQVRADVMDGYGVTLDECTVYGEPETGVDLLVRSSFKGEAKVKLTADNGVSAIVSLTFVEHAGVDAIMADGVKADVYTADGVLIAKDADADFINSLKNRVLILVKDGKAYKVLR